jgi:putative ABC transport system permease protein
VIELALSELRRRGTQHVSTVLVAVIASVFATMLIEMDTILQAQSIGGGFINHGFVRLLLDVLGVTFLFVATFVACLVTANTFGIIMAGRIKRIALLRLLGATARTLRGAVVIEGALVGLVGALVGVVVGTVLTQILSGVLVSTGAFVAVHMNLLTPTLVVPIVVGVLSTAGAAWFGSRRILDVSPVEATRRTEEPSVAALRASGAARRGIIFVLFFGGLALLLAGIALGLVTPFALFIAAPGGALSFLGFVLGSSMFLPPVLRLAGRVTGTGPASALASANALRYPARSSRSAVGLTIGVTLVTMFAVAAQSFTAEATPVAASGSGEEAASNQAFLTMTLGILGVLIGFSLVIASIGFVNSLSLSVLQRRREIGLLRALGFTRPQIRQMVFAESIQLTIVGGAMGLIFGVFYGWAGVSVAIASDHHIGGLFWPTIPVALVIAVVVGAFILAILAALLPSRRATSLSPVVALAID